MRQLKINQSITNRESASLEKYLAEISREPLITVDREVELAQKIHQGNKAALEALVKANLRFVVSVAKQYQNQGISLPDLINEGNIGLIRAAKMFDETRGFKFISYAVWWIRQSIQHALSQQARIVRLPLNQVGTLNKINKTIQQYVQEHGRQPTTKELADELDMDENKVIETLKISCRQISVDAPFVEGEENTMLDVMTDEDAKDTDDILINESLRSEIDDVLSSLTEREARIIRMFFGINGPEKTLDEIGTEFNLSRERVRQIKDKAIRRLKNPEVNKQLKYFLG